MNYLVMVFTSKLSWYNVFAKFNLKIGYSLPYYHEVKHYHQDANIEHMKCAADLLDWEKAFTNTSVYEKVAIFKKTINGS